MELADRVSESVIKIFHNAKGSIVHDVTKWTKNLETEHLQDVQQNIEPKEQQDDIKEFIGD